MRLPFLLGRMLFGGYFIMSGVNHFKQTKQLSRYAGMKGAPKPDIAVRATGGMLIAGGTSVLLGFTPKLGATALIGFLAGVSPVMHDFWNEDAEQRMNDMIDFTKNLALVGGATALMAMEEPWPASVTPQPSVRQRARKMLAKALPPEVSVRRNRTSRGRPVHETFY